MKRKDRPVQKTADEASRSILRAWQTDRQPLIESFFMILGDERRTCEALA
jgi:hypothetical protein